jgi:hypothetical protein
LWEIELMNGIAQNDCKMRARLALLISLALAALACAQTTIPNPLHADDPAKPAQEKSAQEKPGQEKPAQEKTGLEAGTRSPGQRLMAEDTRACGADWRLRKAELSKRGETWQSFAKSCRAARKAARGV